MAKLLKKGCEIEHYIGNKLTGQYMPIAQEIAKLNTRFTTEPEARNIEYITEPTTDYYSLYKQLVEGRVELRETLKQYDKDLTIIPGSSLSTTFDKQFTRSKPDNQYHQHIEDRHNISILTASIHYNVDLSEYTADEIIRLNNLIRTEASLILALSASSPFYDGHITGALSSRWLDFPPVPDYIPFFNNHNSYTRWCERMVEEKYMYNHRHLWTSVRPNGDDKPYKLNRLEIRISDVTTHWDMALAIMAWCELRIQYFLQHPELIVNPNEIELIELVNTNEFNIAHNGLGGHFSDWLYEEECLAYNAIDKRIQDMSVLIKELNVEEHIKTIERCLAEGNEANKKLALYHDGHHIPDIMLEWIQEMEDADQKAMQAIKDAQVQPA